MLSYPYYKEFNPDISNDFKDLQNYKLNSIDINYAKKITNNFKFDKCKGKYVIVLDDYKKIPE